MSKRLRPNLQRSRSALLHEHKLPIVVAQTGQLLVVVDVKERFTRAFRDLPGEVGYEIIAVEVDLVGHVADFVALAPTRISARPAARRARQSSRSLALSG